jgi:hypothetical protein
MYNTFVLLFLRDFNYERDKKKKKQPKFLARYKNIVMTSTNASIIQNGNETNLVTMTYYLVNNSIKLVVHSK